MEQLPKIRLGLCCLNTTLRNQRPSIFCSRGVIRRTIREKGLKIVVEKSLQNLEDMKKMILWNVENGIQVYRMSSDMFSHATDTVCSYSIDFAFEKLKELGEFAKQHNQRLTFHPGQYNVLGTPREDALESTIRELTFHADIFKHMNCGIDSVMVIHAGGTYGDKNATKKRWVDNFKKLPEHAQKRLVLENCEKSFTVQDCLDVSNMIFENYGFYLPIVIDSHHDNCYRLLHKDEKLPEMREWIPKVIETWKSRGIHMKCHISEQGDGRIGKHSDYIEKIPEYFLEIPEKYKIPLDIMVEAKKKEKAIKQLYNTYPDIFL